MPADVAGYIPLVIYNGTQNYNANEIFFFVPTNSFAQILQLTENMDGHFLAAPVTPTPTSGMQSTYFSNYYAKSLADIESLGGGYYAFYIPNNVAQAASRIYFSVGEQLNWWITSAGQLQQLDNVYELTNPTYYKFFDKIEYTVANPTGSYRLIMNSTIVDFYGLPLSFYINYDKQDAPMGPTTSYTGLSPTIPRETVFHTYANSLTSIPGNGAGTWGNLLCTYTSPNGSTSNVRLNASNAAIKQSTPVNIVFPTNYLQSNPWSSCQWLTSLWSNAQNNAYYQQPANALTIGLSLSLSSEGTATGTVNSAGDFVFTINSDNVSRQGGKITFPRPTSAKAFFTGAVNDCVPQPIITAPAIAQDALIIWQIFSSAFNAGFLPVGPTSQMAPLNQDMIRTLGMSGTNYYINSTALCTGPWYDFFSGVLYGMGTGNYTEYYTSPFTDVLNISGVITVVDVNDALPKVFITVGSMTGSTAPNPFDDSNMYIVKCIGVGSGASATLNGMPFGLGNQYTLSGSSISLSVTYSSGPYAAASPWVVQVAPSIPLVDPVIPGAPTLSLDSTTSPPTLNITIGGAPSS
jgi:hypothetical protein